MEFPALINWMIPFPVLGVLGGIFLFFLLHFIEHTVSKQWRPYQTPHSVASDLV